MTIMIMSSISVVVTFFIVFGLAFLISVQDDEIQARKLGWSFPFQHSDEEISNLREKARETYKKQIKKVYFSFAVLAAISLVLGSFDDGSTNQIALFFATIFICICSMFFFFKQGLTAGEMSSEASLLNEQNGNTLTSFLNGISDNANRNKMSDLLMTIDYRKTLIRADLLLAKDAVEKNNKIENESLANDLLIKRTPSSQSANNEA